MDKISNAELTQRMIVRCDECGLPIMIIDSKGTIDTVDCKTLCSGCDSKRLSKENYL